MIITLVTATRDYNGNISKKEIIMAKLAYYEYHEIYGDKEDSDLKWEAEVHNENDIQMAIESLECQNLWPGREPSEWKSHGNGLCTEVTEGIDEDWDRVGWFLLTGATEDEAKEWIRSLK